MDMENDIGALALGLAVTMSNPYGVEAEEGGMEDVIGTAGNLIAMALARFGRDALIAELNNLHGAVDRALAMIP